MFFWLVQNLISVEMYLILVLLSLSCILFSQWNKKCHQEGISPSHALIIIWHSPSSQVSCLHQELTAITAASLKMGGFFCIWPLKYCPPKLVRWYFILNKMADTGWDSSLRLDFLQIFISRKWTLVMGLIYINHRNLCCSIVDSVSHNALTDTTSQMAASVSASPTRLQCKIFSQLHHD